MTTLSIRGTFLPLIAATAVVGCRLVSAPQSLHFVARATAALVDNTGREVGRATFAQDSAGKVHIKLALHGISAGAHGAHLHSVGRCDGIAFGGAGAHVNPLAMHHGLASATGPHAGDLPNIVVAADSTGTLEVSSTSVSLTAGSSSLLDADGSAIVVHAATDDQMTDPTGNSGARIACGVLTAINP